MADSSNSETRKERRAAARADRQRAEAARAQTRKRLWQLGGVAALAAIVVIVIVIATSGGDAEKTAADGGAVVGATEANALFEGIPQRGATLGSPDAPVTLVEFADLQCPYCKQFSETVLPTIVDQYVRTGQVKIVFRSFPFIGDDSIRAAQMAEALGEQGKMWNFVDIAFRNQGGENEGWVTDELLRDVAGAIPDVDVERAMEDRSLARVNEALAKADEQRLEFGIQGTPSFLIGADEDSLELVDSEQANPLDVGAFSARIDEALQTARR